MNPDSYHLLFEPDSEALVQLEAFGGEILSPCDIIGVYNNSIPVESLDEINAHSEVKIRLCIGSEKEPQRVEPFEFKVSIQNVKFQ